MDTLTSFAASASGFPLHLSSSYPVSSLVALQPLRSIPDQKGVLVRHTSLNQYHGSYDKHFKFVER